MRPPGPVAARVGLAAMAMIVVAEGAAWLLRPGEEPIEPLPVAEEEWFGEAQLEEARSYRSGQRWLLAASVGAQGAVLVALALGRPTAARRGLARLGARPLAGAAVAGAGIAIAVELAALPPGVAAHERAVDYGLSTQAIGPYLWDVARGAAITAGLAAAGAALLIALVRRFPRHWWAPGAAAATALAALLTWVAPVVLGPIFNRFDRLPEDSELRAEVLGLAERAGIDVGEVYRVDASRRVTTLNAYVDGLGSTKRVVLYDNLIERAERPELRSVVAHELAHVANDDIPRGLAFVAIVAPFGLLFTREFGGAIARRAGAEPGSPPGLPALLFALAVAATVIGVVGNQLSRSVEASADDFALELTDDPRALIDLQLRLAAANLSDPDPPEVVTFLLGSHPTTLERIGAALAYDRRDSP